MHIQSAAVGFQTSHCAGCVFFVCPPFDRRQRLGEPQHLIQLQRHLHQLLRHKALRPRPPLGVTAKKFAFLFLVTRLLLHRIHRVTHLVYFTVAAAAAAAVHTHTAMM